MFWQNRRLLLMRIVIHNKLQVHPKFIWTHNLFAIDAVRRAQTQRHDQYITTKTILFLSRTNSAACDTVSEPWRQECTSSQQQIVKLGKYD